MVKFYRIKILFYLFLVCISLTPFISVNSGYGMEVSKAKAIEIAKKTASDIGYDLKKLQIHIDKNNTKWEEEVKSRGGIPVAIKEKLAERIFWAVYFAPLPDPAPNIMIAGGGLWVFIDTSTGEVILYLKAV